MSFASSLETGFKIGSSIRERKKKEEALKQFEGIVNEMIGDVQPGNDAANGTQQGTSQDSNQAQTQAAGPASGLGPMQKPKGSASGAPVDIPEAVMSRNPVAGGLAPILQNAQPKEQLAPVAKTKPFDLEQAREKLLKLDTFAAKHPEFAPQAEKFRTAYMQRAISEYQRGFKGDLNTPEGIAEYVKYMADGAAKVGKPLSPAEVKANYDTIKELKNEGFDEALKRFQMGDFEGGANAWNTSGKQRVEFLDYKPAPFNLAGVEVPGYEVTYRDQTGKIHKLNTAETMFRAESLMKQLEAARKGKDSQSRRVNEAARTNIQRQRADIESKRAAASARSVIAGKDDQYLIDKMTGKKVALGVGNKPTGKGARGGKTGLTPSDRLAAKKHAIKQFQTSIGVSDGMAGISGLSRRDQNMYKYGVKLVEDLIDNGGSTQDAAALGKDYQRQVEELRKAGVKNPEKEAYQMFSSANENGKKQKKSGKDYSAIWR